MKKIKGLLLFGILTLLGIGISFGYEYTFHPVEYYTYKNQYSNYIFGGGAPFNFMNANYGLFTGISQFLRYNSSTLDDSLLDFSNYTLTGKASLNYISSHLYVNNSSVSLLFRTSQQTYGSYLFRLSSGVNSINSLFSEKSSNFIRINCGVDSIYVDNIFNSSSPCQSFRTFVFTSGNVYDSNRGIVNDLNYNGVDYVRGSVVPGVGEEYSFSFSPTFSKSGTTAFFDSSSIPYYFATVSPSLNGTWQVYNGLFILKLDTLYKKSNTGDFRILAIALTGVSVDNYDFIYSRYSCPFNSLSFIDCSFIDGGYLRSSNLTNSFTSYNGKLFSLTGTFNNNTNQYYTLYKNFVFFLLESVKNSSMGNFSPVIYSVESSDIIQLYRPWFSSAGAYNAVNYSLGLSSSEDINIFDYIGISGGGNWSTYSGTVSLNNCIDTQICWDFTGSQGDIIRMCTTQCVSSGVIASGGYIGSDGTYYFVNSPISIEDSLKTDNPENMFTGSYIDSGGILSLSYFTDYFQPGAKKIGVCPFKYYEGPLDFMTKLKIGDVYLLMPVLCFYSAFQQGKNVSFFDLYDVNDGLFSQPLLYGESDNHKLLFAFFDVLFSIGLLGLIRYLSRHLF